MAYALRVPASEPTVAWREVGSWSGLCVSPWVLDYSAGQVGVHQRVVAVVVALMAFITLVIAVAGRYDRPSPLGSR